MTFGEYLRAQREQKGWTQPEAAAKAEIEQSYLSKLETGKSFPSQDVFERLAATYGFDAEAVARTLDAQSLKDLREVAQVRSAIITLQTRSMRLARSWLAAGVASVFLGGASLGLFSLAEDDEHTVYHYTSPGVIAPGEDMNVYSILDRSLSRISAKTDPKRPPLARFKSP